VNWQHLHRLTKQEHMEKKARQAAGQAEAEADGSIARADDEDELPWQVIFIGDENMVERLRNGYRYYQQNIRMTIGGATCEQRPGGCQEEECPFDLPVVLEAEQHLEESNWVEAAAAYAAERSKDCADCPREAEFRKWPKWREATLRVAEARCLRRARMLDKALDVLDPVMRM
jgi:hypothetical protein